MSTASSHDHGPGAPTTRGRTLDHAAALYDWVQPIVTLGRESALNHALIDELDLYPAARVLDVGCGTGSVAAGIGTFLDAEAGGEAVGIDAAPKMIAVADRKRSSPTVRFQVASAERLPFPDATFDRACSSFFFHHVDMELKVMAVHEVRRVLKPGGKFVVLDVDTPTTWYGRWCTRFAEVALRQPEIGENRRGLLRQAFTDGGFTEFRLVRQWQGYMSLFVVF